MRSVASDATVLFMSGIGSACLGVPLVSPVLSKVHVSKTARGIGKYLIIPWSLPKVVSGVKRLERAVR